MEVGRDVCSSLFGIIKNQRDKYIRMARPDL